MERAGGCGQTDSAKETKIKDGRKRHWEDKERMEQKSNVNSDSMDSVLYKCIMCLQNISQHYVETNIFKAQVA